MYIRRNARKAPVEKVLVDDVNDGYWLDPAITAQAAPSGAANFAQFATQAVLPPTALSRNRQIREPESGLNPPGKRELLNELSTE